MKPSKIIKALKTGIKARQPVHLWGPPGVGKSSMIFQLAKALELDLIDIRAALLDPVDLRGIPYVEKGITKWAPPEFFPRSGKGILFLDELSGAPLSVQLALYQLVLDKRLGEYDLPEGWVIVAAGNREKDRAVVQRMSTALANRFIHLDVDVDHQDWFEWAVKAGVAPSVVAFHKFREVQGEASLLFAFDPTSDAKAFPTPRSWEFVSHTLWAEPPKDVEYEMIKGTVGEAAAREFIGFLAVQRDLPEIALIEKHPLTTMLPKEPSACVAVAMALVNRADAVTTPALMTYMARLSPEYTTLFLKGIEVKDRSLLECREVIEWTTTGKNIELFRAA